MYLFKEIKINDNLHVDRTRLSAASVEHHATKPRIPVALRVYNLAVYLWYVKPINDAA